MGRTVELKWRCADCGAEDILGRHKRCPSCGSPREKGEMKMDGLDADDYDASGRNRAATVTDPELLKLAEVGFDWFCTHCESGNRGNGAKCSSCGSTRYGAPEENHPEAPSEPPTDLGEKPQGAKWQTSRPGVSWRTPTPPPPDDPPPRSWFDRPENKLILLGSGALVLLAALITFGVWAMQTHDVRGAVAGMTWSRTIHSERWTDTTVRLWKHQTTESAEAPPRGGVGGRAGLDLLERTCRSEHFDDERYVCGHHEECKDVYRTESERYSCSKSERYKCGETCRDKGNGFAHCSDKYCTRNVSDTCTRSKKVFDHKSCHDVKDYCTRPIMKDKCDYLTQEWHGAGNRDTSGRGRELSWATVTSGDEVRFSYSATYTVAIMYTDSGEPEAYDLVLSDSKTTLVDAETTSREYLAWDVGDTVLLKINNLGGVASTAHAGILP